LGRVRVPEPMQLAEVTPTPCRQHNWMHGRTIFARHDGMMVGKLDAEGRQPFCHDETMLAQLSHEKVSGTVASVMVTVAASRSTLCHRNATISPRRSPQARASKTAGR